MSALVAPVGTDGFLHEPLAHLPGISLAALVEDAALLTRVDRKYVLPVRALPDLLAAVPPSTRVLDIDGRRIFGYRSTYLDTADLASFHAAGRRRRRRFKVRTRSYLDTGSSWLEVKIRGARRSTTKVRMPHEDGELHHLTPLGRLFVDDALIQAGVPGVRAVVLSPVLVTAYRRSTLYLPDTRSRVTVDVELGWTSLLGGTHRDLDRPATAIVETKTGSTPSGFDRLLWAAGHRPVRISKYAVGLAALNPELPRLKWNGVMNRHLALPRRVPVGLDSQRPARSAEALPQPPA